MDTAVLSLTAPQLRELANYAIKQSVSSAKALINKLLLKYEVDSKVVKADAIIAAVKVASTDKYDDGFGDIIEKLGYKGTTGVRFAYAILRKLAVLGKQIKAAEARKGPLASLIPQEGTLTQYGYLRNAGAEGLEEIAKLLTKEVRKGKIPASEFAENLDNLYDTLSDAADIITGSAVKNNIRAQIEEDKVIPGSLSTREDLYSIVKKLEAKSHKSKSKKH